MAPFASGKSSARARDLDKPETDFHGPYPVPETDPSAERALRAFAVEIGVAGRILDLLADCDRALSDFAGPSRTRWLWRVEGQRQLLLRPPIRVIAAIATCLCEEDPSLAEPLAPLLARLIKVHPELWPFHRRACAARATRNQGCESAGLVQSAASRDRAE